MNYPFKELNKNLKKTSCIRFTGTNLTYRNVKDLSNTTARIESHSDLTELNCKLANVNTPVWLDSFAPYVAYKLLNNTFCTLQFPIQQKHQQFLSGDHESGHLKLTVTRTPHGSPVTHRCPMQIHRTEEHTHAVKAPWSSPEQGQAKHPKPTNPHKSSGFRGICSCKYNPFPQRKQQQMCGLQADPRPKPDLESVAFWWTPGFTLQLQRFEERQNLV